MTNSQPIYFIKADFGKLGAAWVERDVNETDRATTIRDLIGMQIDRPLAVIEMNPDEGTSRDVSEDIAREIADWSSSKGEPLHPRLIDFIHDNAGGAWARGLKAA